MAATIPTTEPLEVTAGDTVAWTRDLSDYPASTWTLSYSLVCQTQRHTITATADGDTHSITIPIATTATWAADLYSWIATVADNADPDLVTERHVVDSGKLTVNINPTAAPFADQRSHVKRVLDALEALLEGKATKDAQQYSLGGRQLIKMTPRQLLNWHGIYSQKYKAEQQAERVAAGETVSSKIRYTQLGRRV